MRLEGKTAIITGGARGIGAAISLALRDAGVPIEIAAADTDKLRTILQGMPGVESVTAAEQELLILCDESVSAEQVNKYCFEQGVILNKLQVKRKSLETRFLEITGKQSDR